MGRSIIEKHLFKSSYLDIAFRRYKDFKQTSLYDEKYKYEILSELNDFLFNKEITEETIIEITKAIRDKNPQQGSFVHWSNTSDLFTYANKRPAEVAELLTNLYENTGSPIEERIRAFREKGKEFKSDISLGAPLFGYLLAAYDYKTFPLYKEETFTAIKKTFEIEKKLSTVHENYKFYYDFCQVVHDYLQEEDTTITMLDIQDFFYCISTYEQPIVESAVEFVHFVSKELAYFSNNDLEFLEAIKSLDEEILKERRDFYQSGTKVNKIRFQLLDHHLKGNELTIAEFERIKSEVNEENEKNILQAWSNFTILFQIYYFPIKDKIQLELRKIHESIRNIDVFSEMNLEEEKVMNGFSWNQNFGGSRSWLAVYPKEKTTHKVTAQLFMAIQSDQILYGLLYGTEHPKDGKRNLTTLTDSKTFSYEKMKQKFIEVYPEFIEGNDTQTDSPSIESRELAEPFSTIFRSFEKASWVFDFVLESLEKIGVTEIGDNRLAVTSTTTERGKSIHIDFCNWLLFGFYRQGEELTMRLPLIANKALDSYHPEYFTQKADEIQVALYTLPEEAVNPFDEDVKETYEKTLLVIKERFKNHRKSPYRKFNKEVIEKAIFDTDFREKVLYGKVDIDPNVPVPEENGEDPTPSIEKPEPEDKYVEIPSVSFEQESLESNLYFEERETLIRQIKTALQNGKHIILTGPPGTGKSKLAKEICVSFGAEYEMATATSDWSTYETIGGYKPKSDGTLMFNPGLFLNCFKDVNTIKPKNKWLIIDELNRADIDKAFGALFSALTGDPITLNFQTEQNQPLLLRPQDKELKVIPNEYEYIIPNDWRLIGTMNTLDKASLYEMSYAFMRRFAFIPVEVPKKITEETMDLFLIKWEIRNYGNADKLAFIWRQINEYRKIGPAIMEDLARHTALDDDFTSALILYVLPQFEGLLDTQILEFIKRLEEVEEIDTGRLKSFVSDFFHI